MHTRSLPCPLLILSLLLAAGCGSSAPPEASVSDETSEPTQQAAARDDVKLDTLNYDEIQERIASKKGKVVVLDAWSTSCPPCMKDFHNLVELHKQYGPEELACISLSFDYEGLGKPEEVREPVLTFLKSQGATFDNLMSNEESDVLYRKFKLNAVPAVFVYDRLGKLRERFESEGAYEKVRELVAKLVKEPADAAAENTTAEQPPRDDSPDVE
jgi:thiol-disulfide isomerase/thioredoxin